MMSTSLFASELRLETPKRGKNASTGFFERSRLSLASESPIRNSATQEYVDDDFIRRMSVMSVDSDDTSTLAITKRPSQSECRCGYRKARPRYSAKGLSKPTAKHRAVKSLADHFKAATTTTTTPTAATTTPSLKPISAFRFDRSSFQLSRVEDSDIQSVLSGSGVLQNLWQAKLRSEARSCRNRASRVDNSPPRKSCRNARLTRVGDCALDEGLPVEGISQDGCKYVSSETVLGLLRGDSDLKSRIDHFVIVDCRYWYEYAGGHIRGAIHVQDRNLMEKLYESNREGKDKKRVAWIFHCEFSAHRGPQTAKLFRAHDRNVHKEQYPKLAFPNVYLLRDGFKAFYEHCEERVIYIDGSYVSMWDESFSASRTVHASYRKEHWSDRKSRRKCKSRLRLRLC